MSEEKLTLGQYFRREREARGIELKEIEAQTKIPAQVLKFLEDDNVEMLPPRAFLRGFLQVIASEFDLDDEELLGRMEEMLASQERGGDDFLPTRHQNQSLIVKGILVIVLAVIIAVVGFCMYKRDPLTRQGASDPAQTYSQLIVSSGDLHKF